MVRKNATTDTVKASSAEDLQAQADAAAAGMGATPDAPAASSWTWASFVPSFKQAVASAIVAGLASLGTSFYKDYSSAANAGSEVSAALKTAGRDKVALPGDAEEAMLNRMASSCAISFSGVMGSALQQCAAACQKTGKKG